MDYEEVYCPVGTKRNARVCICNSCGLVFSIHDDIPYSREPNISGDADWGNVRFCKGQRFDVVKGMLSPDAMRVLDVGSSRGDFVRWYQDENPKASITALEPDTRIASYPEGVEFVGKRLEDAGLPANYYDFLYCNQTLEHTDSAARVLQEMYRVMKPGGRLFLEVPNIQVIDYPLNVEEFFIDKHNYHFNRGILTGFMESIGFKMIRVNDDNLNVRVLAKKMKEPQGSLIHYDPDFNYELIEYYAEVIQKNRAKLPAVGKQLNRILDTDMKVAFWGANTIFDLLVKYGDLKPKRVEMLVDTYIAGKHPSVHGVHIWHPDALKVYQPDTVVILARHSAEEIAKRCRELKVRNIVQFADLLAGVNE